MKDWSALGDKRGREREKKEGRDRGGEGGKGGGSGEQKKEISPKFAFNNIVFCFVI